MTIFYKDWIFVQSFLFYFNIFFNLIMKYTQENLAQFADMDIDLYAIGNKIIDKLTDYNPEIFDGYLAFKK